MQGRARRTGRHFLPAAALVVLGAGSVAATTNAPSTSIAPSPSTVVAANPGRLAYLRDGTAWVDSWSSAAAMRLPQSAGARFVTIAGNGGAAVYGTGTGSKVVLSRPPYRTAVTVRIPPGRDRVTGAHWTRDGSLLWLQFADGSTASLDVRTTAFKLRAYVPGAVSSDGRVRAVTGRTDVDTEDLAVEDGTPAPARAVFTVRERMRLFEALRAQRSPAVDAIVKEHDTALATDATQWRTGPPAVSPDGEALYWSSNLGGGAGAAGNTSWLLLKTDVRTGRTIGLGRFGVQSGRLPELSVAPDGRALLVTSSVHASAVENPVSNTVLDLVSQRSTTLTFGDRPGWVAIQWGQCWSSDARLVAVSRYAYDPRSIDPTADPGAAQYTLVLKEAATDRTVRTVAGAVAPSCG